MSIGSFFACSSLRRGQRMDRASSAGVTRHARGVSRSFALVLLLCVAIPAWPSWGAPLILNEFNAVASGEYLNGGNATVDGDGSLTVVRPAALREAQSDEISFLAHSKYRTLLAETAAAAVLVTESELRPHDRLTLLRCKDPGRAFTKVVEAFSEKLPGPTLGVHESAVVDRSAKLGEAVSIGALCSIGAGAVVGAGAVLHPGVVLAAGVRVGAETEIHPGVVLYARTTVGERCLIHSGTVIGSDGFGFDPTPEGWVKVPQVGSVLIEDDVEIGAGCTIDRGRFGPTRIGRGSKLDNQVHLGHNVEIGEGCLLVAQVGVAGSAQLGKAVIIGGQTGVGGHVTIGAGARVGGQSAVFGDLEGGADYLGYPAEPRRDSLKRLANTRRLSSVFARVRELEERLKALEGEGEE